MRTSELLRRLWRRRSLIIRDRRGSVAPMFGVLSVAVVSLIGITVDYSRIENARASLQQATDATALALAIERAAGLKDSALSDAARQQVSAQVPQHLNDGLRIVSAAAAGTKVTVMSTASVRNSFGGMLGRMESTIQTKAVADFSAAGSARKAEIALVFDLTSEMKEKEKLNALRKALLGFLDTAARVADNSQNIKIALVPFAEHVKVGTINRPAAWLKFNGQNEMPKLSSEQQAKIQSEERAAIKLAMKVTQAKIERMNWEGCVADTVDPTDMTFDAAHQHPGVRCLSPEWQKTDANAITPLTTKFDQLKQQLGRVQPEGCANTAIGTVWGMGSLMPQGPLGQSAAFADQNTKKIMIIVSGAPNSTSRQFGVCLGQNPREQKMLPAAKAACDKAREAGITIHAVNLMDGDAEVLRHCAGDPAKFHEARTANDIAGIMEKIGKDVLVGAAKTARLVD